MGLQKECPECSATFETRWSRVTCCSKKCARLRVNRLRHGGHAPNWKGGLPRPHSAGYTIIYVPDHPRADKRGYVLEHLVVMERKLGRYLLPGERVHHRNLKRSDNSLGNLELWVTKDPSGARTADLAAFILSQPEIDDSNRQAVSTVLSRVWGLT